MNLEEQVERRIRLLLEQRKDLPLISERTPLISEILYEEFFFCETDAGQLLLKDCLPQILYRYQNISGDTATAVMAEVLYLCLKVKVSCGESLVRLLQSGYLTGRVYDGKELVLITLNLLGNLMPQVRTKQALVQLFSNELFEKDVALCNHFLSVFAIYGANDGIHRVLDRLVEMRLSAAEAKLVAYQFLVSFRHIDPYALMQKYLEIMATRPEIKEKWLNIAFLKFAEGASLQPEVFDRGWKVPLEVLSAFSEFYSPEREDDEKEDDPSIRCAELIKRVEIIAERYNNYDLEELDRALESAQMSEGVNIDQIRSAYEIVPNAFIATIQ